MHRHAIGVSKPQSLHSDLGDQFGVWGVSLGPVGVGAQLS